MTSKTVAELLGKTGLCVAREFLKSSSLRSTADDFNAIHASGGFHLAGVGRRSAHGGEPLVRNDETFWLDRERGNQAQNFLWRKLDLLRLAFNRSMFLGLTHFEGHYAAYPEGGYYQRHKDCLRGDSGRVVSFILYLNRDWAPADGGRLRVYASTANGGESHTDVDPVGGTMVCFMSGESEHEVMLSHRRRLSLTGWFKRR